MRNHNFSRWSIMILVSFILTWLISLPNKQFGYRAFKNDQVVISQVEPEGYDNYTYTISSINVDGKLIAPEEMELEGWQTSDTPNGYPLKTNGYERGNEIRFKTPKKLVTHPLKITSEFRDDAGNLKIIFYRGQEAQIYANHEEPMEHTNEINLIAKKSFFGQYVIFFLGVLGFLLIFNYVFKQYKQNVTGDFKDSLKSLINKGTVTQSLIGGIGVALLLYLYGSIKEGQYIVLFRIPVGFSAVLSFLLMLFLFFVGLRLTLRDREIVSEVYGWSLFFINPLVVTFLTELIYNPEFPHIENMYYGVSYLVVIVFQLLLYFITRSRQHSSLIILLAGVLLGIGNQVLIDLRQSPVIPAFLGTLGVAREVVKDIPIEFNSSTTLGVIYSVLWSYVLTSQNQRRVVTSFKRYFIPLVTYLAVFSMTLPVINRTYFNPDDLEIRWWKPTHTFFKTGSIYSFYNLAINQKLKSPEGFSEEKVAKILDQYAKPTKDDSAEKPNIILIQTESLGDYHGLNDTLFFTEDPLAYTKEVTEDFISGEVFMSVIGGGTIKSEYEVLSSNELDFFPPGTDPFWQYVKDGSHSLPRLLKKQGYDTFAAHPHLETNYSRNVSWTSLGFDDMRFLHSYDWDRVIRSFISDEQLYDEIIKAYDEKGEDPLFYFTVTMQNHGGYFADFKGAIDIDSHSNVDPVIVEFANLVKESDKAFERLVEYFSDYDEPTIIMLYSDHLPPIHEKFRDLAYGSDATIVDDYRAPFFMWANYPIESEHDVQLSMNYVAPYTLKKAQKGVKPSAYYNYLMDLYEKYPISTQFFKFDREGNEVSQDSDFLAKQAEWHQIIYADVTLNKQLDKYFSEPQ